jgi:hypothetical protein
MTNMSYCRFRNTLIDLQDCAEELETMYDNGYCDLDQEEIQAAIHLIEQCENILSVSDDYLDLLYAKRRVR